VGNQNNKYLTNEKDLPPDLEFVDRPPIVTGSTPVAAPPAQDFDRYQGAVLSAPIGLQPDLVKTQIGGGLPVYRIMPAAPSGQAGVNSGVHSNAAPLIFPVASAAHNAQTTANSAQETADAVAAVSFQGAWSNTATYSQGASVDYLGAIYVSLINANLNNTPNTSPTDWAPTGGTPNYQGAWSSSTAYTIGQTVSVSTSLYIALQNSTNQNPTSTSGFWQLLSNASTFFGAWNNSTQYSIGSEVSNNGSFWIAITANINQTPAPGSSFWVNVGTAAILLANYNNSTAYSIGMEVVGTDGNVYSAIAATTGHAPPNASFWQLVGPATLNSVADGSTKFGNTASGLVYRPLSNPLTGHDAGASATINIAAFTMRTSSKGDISENSGSVTGLSFNTLYYIYFSDPSLNGGSVTYIATTTRETAISNGGATGQFFVGSVTTPLSGQPDTTGNNDGGSGTLGTSMVSQVFAANGTWTKPTGALYVQVTAVGAGGGGGGSNVTGGAGGGGGGQSTNIYPASVLTSTVSITIGGAGSGGATSVNGNPGGTTSFGAFLQAGGGAGGAAGTGGNATGGAGGKGTSNGGNGGNGSSASGGPGTSGQDGNGLAAGGGGGGGSAAGGFGQAGGTGGHQGFAAGNAAGGSSGSSGVPGGNGTSVTAGTPQGGSGAGGGGSSNSNVGSAGGNGGSYGGAGGGGGGANTSGGNGQPGICVVTTFL